MKDKLSLMEAESREEGQEGVELRLEKTRLAAALFDQAGTRAAAVSVNGTSRCVTDYAVHDGWPPPKDAPSTSLSGMMNRICPSAMFQAGCTDLLTGYQPVQKCAALWTCIN